MQTYVSNLRTMRAIPGNIQGKLNKQVNAFLHDLETGIIDKGKNKQITYEEFLSNKMLIIAAIRMGIPYSLFQTIQSFTPFTENDWAELLNISTKSLQRYKAAANHHFKPIHSEKIIELAEVTQAGLEVFGSMEKMKLWLQTPNYALGNLPPIELLKDSYGKEMVLGELTRINHGILI